MNNCPYVWMHVQICAYEYSTTIFNNIQVMSVLLIETWSNLKKKYICTYVCTFILYIYIFVYGTEAMSNYYDL